MKIQTIKNEYKNKKIIAIKDIIDDTEKEIELLL